MKLVVNQDCCSCSYCYRACPVGAPYYDGEQTRIDQEKCISCGKCVKKCPMGAIYDSENPPKPMEPHAPKELEADAVIIGAGGSGMIAACRIAETGKKVVVLEKAKRTGCGAIHVAGPLQFFDTKWALDAGAKPVVEEKIAQTLAQNGDHLDHELVKKTLHAMPRFFDWLATFAPVEEKFELTEARGGPGGPPPMPDGGDEMPMPGEMPAPGGEAPEFMQAGTGMPGSGMGGNTGLVVDTKSLCPPSPAFHNAGEFIMDHLFEYAEKLGVTIKLVAKSCVTPEGMYVMVTPRMLRYGRPLASVHDVVNAVCVKGNMLGDVMFYGAGAGKLPTASAVVSDIVDAVRHADGHVNNGWSQEKKELISIDEVENCFYVRVEGNAAEREEELEKLFGGVTICDNVIDGEFAFVTGSIKEAEFAKAACSIKGIKNTIRIEL